MHGLPYLPQSFDMGVEKKKGAGNETDKKLKSAKASNEWFFIIYPIWLISDLSF